MIETRYGFGVALPGASFDGVIAGLTDALKDEGFGVLTRIDVRETLNTKLGIDFPPYVILGACNPTLAKQALELEPELGLLLPCNVVVREAERGEVVVLIADPKAMFALVDNPAVAAIAGDVEQRLRRVIAALAAQPYVRQ